MNVCRLSRKGEQKEEVGTQVRKGITDKVKSLEWVGSWDNGAGEEDLAFMG